VIADPNGNVVDAQTATGDQVRHTYTATSTIVENSKGVELPSTGGEGTMMLITFGSIVAMAFAVLLITHKKMSIYHD
jgi:LPXTG-motif cell wall-anchored protein